MRFSDSEIRHLESLAMIDSGEDSRERLRFQMSGIIEFLRKIERAGESTGETEGGTIPPRAAGEADKAQPSLDREEVLGEAPDSLDGQFRVPPVIEGSG